MEIDAPQPSASAGSSAAPPSPPDQIIVTSGFQLESYINRYSGHTRIARLQLVAQRCPPLAAKAFAMLAEEIRGGINTDIFQKYKEHVGPTFPPTWYDETSKQAEKLQEKLEADLAAGKANVVKEVIRSGYMELGDFFYRRGDLIQAMKNYLRSRDYCSSPRNIAESCFRVIQTAADQDNFVQVNNHINKVENILVQSQVLEPSVSARLTAAAGLVLLRSKSYKQAANKFLQVSTELGDSFTAVCVAEDVATYGALCALAEFDREELRQYVIEGGVSFRNFLELVPKIRGVVNDIYECKYGSALAVLENMKGELQLDLHLKDHILDLIKMIRSRCIVQYFSPYMSVSLESMSTAFACSLSEMESSVAKLIMDGKIAARIDSQLKTLHVRQSENRAESYGKIAKLSETYIGNMTAMLLRMSCLEHDFVVRGKPGMAGVFNQAPESRFGVNQQDSGDLPAAMHGDDEPIY